MFNLLYKIRNELKKHHSDRSQLIELYIKDRLDLTIDTYDKELNDSFMYLEKINCINMMNKMTKGDK